MHEEIAVRERLELQARGSPQVGLRLKDHLLVPVAEHQDRLVGQLRRVGEQAAGAHLRHLDRRPGSKPRRRPLLPSRQLLLPSRPLRAGLFVGSDELAADVVDHRPLLGRVDVGPRLVGVVQKRKQAVILVVRDRIELVRMTLGALGRQPEHRFAEAVDAVEHLDHPEFLRDDRSFLVDRAIAQEARGDDLLLRCIRQKITGDLLHDELVVGHVAVERSDHPVAPDPHLATMIFFVAVGIGIAGEVEPVPCPLLAIAVAREQGIDRLLVAVGLEGGELLGRRRQADEIEIDAAAERGGVGLRRRREPLRGKVRGDDRVDRTRAGGDSGHGRPLREHERPMRVVLGSGGDPFFKCGDLRCCEGLLLVGWGHDRVGVVRQDAAHQFALVSLARHDRRLARLAPLESILTDIKPEIPLAALLVEAMAVATVLGEDRLHVPLVVGPTGGQRLSRR